MPLDSEAPYQCPYCFTEQWVGIDPSAGGRQQYTEDCPICCRPILFKVVVDRDGDCLIESAERE
jgi:hypothetical protein